MARLTPLPPSLPFFHPAALAATWFGAGLIRPAPGTWGTLFALPFAILVGWAGGSWALLFCSLAAFMGGTWSAGLFCRAAEKDDAPEVVIDEVAVIFLVLAALPMTIAGWTAGFFLFRFFDILKPWPISAVERRFKGGFGVMIDDMIAALFAILSFALLDAIWLILT